MNKYSSTILALTLGWLMISCGAEQDEAWLEDNSGKADMAATCGSEPIFYSPPEDVSGAGIGAARVQALQNFANELMVRKACEANWELGYTIENPEQMIPFNDEPSPDDPGYRLLVGTNGCLEQQMIDDQQHDQMPMVLQYVASWIGSFHERMNGQLARTFNKVVICHDHDVAYGKLDLNIAKRSLTVGVNFSEFPSVDVYHEFMAWPTSVKDIDEAWEVGHHLKSLVDLPQYAVLTRPKLKKLWKMIDPIGEAQALVRILMLDSARSLFEGLKEARETLKGKADPIKLAGLVEDHTSRNEDHTGISECAKDYLDGASAEQQHELLSSWNSKLRDGRAINGIATAMVTSGVSQARKKDTSKEITIEQDCGLFAFSNIKIVDVSLDVMIDLASAGSADYEPYLAREVVPYEEISTLEVNVKQSGLFCFYLVDDITINLKISFHRSLETQALDQALAEVGAECDG